MTKRVRVTEVQAAAAWIAGRVVYRGRAKAAPFLSKEWLPNADKTGNCKTWDDIRQAGYLDHKLDAKGKPFLYLDS